MGGETQKFNTEIEKNNAVEKNKSETNKQKNRSKDSTLKHGNKKLCESRIN